MKNNNFKNSLTKFKRYTIYDIRYTKNGFTLLEVLLTIVLITTGFVVLLQALGTGLFASGDSENNLVAINLAQEKMEEIRNKSFLNIAPQAKAAVPGFSAFGREVTVATPQTGLKEISVIVYWFSQANELNINLLTYVSDI